MKCVVTLLAAVLAGCALSPQQAATLSTFQLCQIAVSPMASADRQRSAAEEVSRRGESCTPYLAIIRQQMENDAALMQSISDTVNSPRSQPAFSPRLPTQTNCTTYGNRISCMTW